MGQIPEILSEPAETKCAGGPWFTPDIQQEATREKSLNFPLEPTLTDSKCTFKQGLPKGTRGSPWAF